MLINPYIFSKPLEFPQNPFIDYDPANSAFNGLSSVPTLFDVSSNSRNAAVNNSSYTPQLSLIETLNGNRTIYFQNDFTGINTTAQYFYDLPDLSALSSGEAFAVFKLIYNPNTSNELGAGLWNFGTHAVANAMPYQDGNVYDDFGTDVRKGFSSGGNANWNNQWIIYNVKSKTGDFKVYKNGSLLYSTGSNTVDFSATPQLGHSNPGGNYFFAGFVGRFIFFSPALSDADSIAFAAALADYYNL